jgi:hypothetical protein
MMTIVFEEREAEGVGGDVSYGREDEMQELG